MAFFKRLISTPVSLAILIFLVFNGTVSGNSEIKPLMPWEQGMTFGTGIDIFRGDLKTAGEAVLWESIDAPVCHNERELEFRIISDKYELQSTVGIELGAKIDVIVAMAKGTVGATYSRNKAETSLFVLLKASHKECSYNLRKPVLKKDREELYLSNNELFRAGHGDAFLSTVTTGGTFYGIAEIKHRTVEDKAAFKLELKAKVLGATVFKKTIKKTLREINRSADVSFDVIVNGNIIHPFSLDHFFRYYEHFIEETAGERCRGADGYKLCPYKTGYFEKYSVIAKDVYENELADRAVLNISLMENKISKLVEILGEIEKMKYSEASYFFHSESAGSFNKRLMELETKVKDLYEKTFNSNFACRQNYFTKEGNLKKLNPACNIDEIYGYLDDIGEINRMMPQKKLPADCLELQRNYDINSDGVYSLYSGNEGTKHFKAYCKNMEKESVSIPETYLVLASKSPVSGNPSNNFSKYINYKHHYTGEDTVMTTVFHGYLVQPIEEDKYEIIMGQNFYLASHGGPIKVKTTFGGTDILDFTVAGYPSACNHRDDSDGVVEKIANLDLKGTPFVFEVEDSDFKTYGNGTVNDQKVVISSDNKRIDIFKENISGGSCIAVRANRLLIKYGGK